MQPGGGFRCSIADFRAAIVSLASMERLIVENPAGWPIPAGPTVRPKGSTPVDGVEHFRHRVVSRRPAMRRGRHGCLPKTPGDDIGERSL
jgi:hypothetical protein